MPHKDPTVRKAYLKAYYAKHRVRELARRAAWYVENRDDVIASVAAWKRAQGPGYRSRAHRSVRYGLKPADVERMTMQQSGVCAICKRPPSGKPPMHVLHIDHDHDTGQVRAMLCHKCNKGLGAFGDDPAMLSRAFLYLMRYAAVREVA